MRHLKVFLDVRYLKASSLKGWKEQNMFSFPHESCFHELESQNLFHSHMVSFAKKTRNVRMDALRGIFKGSACENSAGA